MTSNMQASMCPLLSYHTPEMGILLPAPVHEDEELSFGVCAPTSSTAVALSLGDALSIAVARKLHTSVGRGPAEVFKSFHPGGAIGAASALSTPKSSMSSTTTMSVTSSSSSTPPLDCFASGFTLPPQRTPLLQPTTRVPPLITQDAAYVPISHIPTVSPQPGQQLRLLDVLLTAIQHPDAKSWVFLSESEIIPPRMIRSLSQHTHVSDLPDRLSCFKRNGGFASHPQAQLGRCDGSSRHRQVRRKRALPWWPYYRMMPPAWG